MSHEKASRQKTRVTLERLCVEIKLEKLEKHCVEIKFPEVLKSK